jgi:hypothetical protein
MGAVGYHLSSRFLQPGGCLEVVSSPSAWNRLQTSWRDTPDAGIDVFHWLTSSSSVRIGQLCDCGVHFVTPKLPSMANPIYNSRRRLQSQSLVTLSSCLVRHKCPRHEAESAAQRRGITNNDILLVRWASARGSSCGLHATSPLGRLEMHFGFGWSARPEENKARRVSLLAWQVSKA